MTLHHERAFWAVAALTFVCACSHTDTYLPAPPTPQIERLTLEKQPTAWARAGSLLYDLARPFSEHAKENDRSALFKAGAAATAAH